MSACLPKTYTSRSFRWPVFSSKRGVPPGYIVPAGSPNSLRPRCSSCWSRQDFSAAGGGFSRGQPRRSNSRISLTEKRYHVRARYPPRPAYAPSSLGTGVPQAGDVPAERVVRGSRGAGVGLARDRPGGDRGHGQRGDRGGDVVALPRRADRDRAARRVHARDGRDAEAVGGAGGGAAGGDAAAARLGRGGGDLR